GGGAGAAVGLQHVAVDDDLALAERAEVDHRAQTAPDQALDLLGAAALLALGSLACAAGVGGARQHAVFGGDPALALAAQEAGYVFFNAGGAQHAGGAEFDQHRAFGVAGEAAGEADGAELVGLALAGSHAGVSYGFWSNLRMVALISRMARSISSSLRSLAGPVPMLDMSRRVVKSSSSIVRVEIDSALAGPALSSSCQHMATIDRLSALGPARRSASSSSRGTPWLRGVAVRWVTRLSSPTGPHTPSLHSARTSPSRSGVRGECSICGAWLPPRQEYSRLRPGWLCASSGCSRPWSSINWVREWSRVRVTAWPRRSRYRRESPACAQCAAPSCTTQATRVVRGASGSRRSSASSRIAWCAPTSARDRNSPGSGSRGRASRWKAWVMYWAAMCAASSPCRCPPMPSATSISSASRE